MSFEIIVTHNFEKELKYLSKKHRSLKKDLLVLLDQLEEKPETGTSLGNNCFKIRLAISSKGKGKSGGARIITCVFIQGKIVYLLSIYDKSEQSSITEKKIQELLKSIKS